MNLTALATTLGSYAEAVLFLIYDICRRHSAFHFTTVIGMSVQQSFVTADRRQRISAIGCGRLRGHLGRNVYGRAYIIDPSVRDLSSSSSSIIIQQKKTLHQPPSSPIYINGFNSPA
jgi:hypothetical protein